MRFKVRDDYLTTLNHKLSASIKKDNSFSSFNNVFKKQGFKLSSHYTYEDTYRHVKELKEVLDKITSIVFRPHIKSSTEEIILRSELSSSLSTQSFNDTIKDTKLWKNKRGEMTPEYVHSEEHIDTIVTYENSFISMLVDEINDELENLLNNLTPLVKSIEEVYEIKGINYGVHSLFNEFKPFTYPYDKSFMHERISTRKIFVLARKLFKRVKNIKASEFYRLTHKQHMDKDVLPTNILTHDRVYAYCYRFYLDNYQKVKEADLYRIDVYYYNYFLTLLFKFIIDNKIGNTAKSKLSKLSLNKDERIMFDEISFKKGMFSFSIKQDIENLGIIVEVRLINKSIRSDTKVSEDKVARYYILTAFTYSEVNQPLIDSLLKDKRDDYYDTILVSQNNTLLDFNNLLNISFYEDNNELLINNLIASFTMLFVSETEIYEDKCPVCGKKHVALHDKDYICEECKSRYSLFVVNDIEILWIKSFRRKEKW